MKLIYSQNESWQIMIHWFADDLVPLRLSTYFLPQVPWRTRYVLFTPSTYQVRTSQISIHSVRTEYRKHDKSTYFRIKVRTFKFCVTYQYVPVRTEYILFCLFLYRLFYISKGYIPGTRWLWWSTYFWFLILLRARRAAQPVCSRAIQALAHALNQITLKHWQVYSLLLGSILVSAWAPGRWCCQWWLAGGFSCGGLASTDLPPPWSAVCSPAAPAPARNAVCTASGRVKDSGFKLGRPWWAAKYLSNPAKFKFRDFISEIKQRADLAWSLNRWCRPSHLGGSPGVRDPWAGSVEPALFPVAESAVWCICERTRHPRGSVMVPELVAALLAFLFV